MFVFWYLGILARRKRGELAINLMRPHHLMRNSRPYLFNKQAVGLENRPGSHLPQPTNVFFLIKHYPVVDS